MKNQITLTFPDNSTRTYPTGTTLLEVAESIGTRLAKDAVAAQINGKLTDLTEAIDIDADINIITGDSTEGHEVLLHSTAHLMAQAVKELFPNARVTIGPAIENRFYYDFDVENPFTDEDLVTIEEKMKELAQNDYPVKRKVFSKDEAIDLFKSMDENYKVEIIQEISPEEVLSAYQQDSFIDLCRGPHVPSTGRIKYFKILNSSGAYWRGDENNKMLQRIYGTVFNTKKELKEYLHMLEEAKKRDHRKLGKELELFAFDDEIGPGLPLWLPKGTIIIEELEKLAKETERKAGYQRVRTPHLTKGNLYEKSGHLKHYKESMYPAMDVDGIDYYVKPMNCPHHHKIYASVPRSYRDLPLRLAEYGTCYRYEKSGQLFGLMRVRSMQMNDAHIYCTKEQFKEEFLSVCQMYLTYFKIFGIDKYEMELCLHSSEGLGKKYVNEPELWIQTEQDVRKALDEGEINYTEKSGEAAFYGPKIDVQVWSTVGRKFTLATNQVDFAIPSLFGLNYTNERGEEATPLCIHRAPLGTHERFIGFLIEHYSADFPLWLAPVQVAILTVSEKVENYAKSVQSKLQNVDIRVDLDDRPDKIGAKIRLAELSKINVMLIIGEREAKENTVSVRRRFEGDIGSMNVDNLSSALVEEINQRRNTYRKEG
ncbi:MAG: threonine--tRNA ligase [Candidatus Marinimicrobia bacterium]|nr:threonine--tRNA ligase [Candidatus Neomarinimicrobiota bacterium]MDP6260499.1 threonine--tRNA ligase [Candidatus Neomarinimicrobiota bacterium]MDP7127176.1 threonine--tRNA ligase [Candidatus Neomarinimicrobiota bacterium]MDP7336696.1 threonine--tRNA ligase [Candidatus Neomarinimicrobiota bacterium]MDP7474706.1 threonine--tRNA ligase [Candidatus Neomarinimicrobiota bacterium]